MALANAGCAANCALELSSQLYGVWSANPTAFGAQAAQALGTGYITSYTTAPGAQATYVPPARTNYACNREVFSAVFRNDSRMTFNMGEDCEVVATVDAQDQQLGTHVATAPTPFLLLNGGQFMGSVPTERGGRTACETLAGQRLDINPATAYTGAMIAQTSQFPGATGSVYDAPGLVQMFPQNTLVASCTNLVLNSEPVYMGSALAMRFVTTMVDAPGQILAVTTSADDPAATVQATDSTDPTDQPAPTDEPTPLAPAPAATTPTTTTTTTTTTSSTTSTTTTTSSSVPVSTTSSSVNPGTQSLSSATSTDSLLPIAPPATPSSSSSSSSSTSTSTSTPTATPTTPQMVVTPTTSSSVFTPAPPPPASVTTSSSVLPPPAPPPSTPLVTPSTSTPIVTPSSPPSSSFEPPPPPVETETPTPEMPSYTGAATAARGDALMLSGSLLGALYFVLGL